MNYPAPPAQRRKRMGSISQRADGRWVVSLLRMGGGRRYAYTATREEAEVALRGLWRQQRQVKGLVEAADQLMSGWVAAGSDEAKRRVVAGRFVRGT